MPASSLHVAKQLRVARRLDEVGFSDIVQIRNKVLELREAGLPVHAFHGGELFCDTQGGRVAGERALEQAYRRSSRTSAVRRRALLDHLAARYARAHPHHVHALEKLAATG